MRRIYSALLLRAMVLLCATWQQTQAVNLIREHKVTKQRLQVKAESAFSKTYLSEDFFIEYFDSEIDLMQLDHSLLLVPFIMNVISIIWISGKHYEIDSLDFDTYHSLKKVKQVFKKMYPQTGWDGELVPKKLVKNRPQRSLPIQDFSAVAFSGGLDSTASVLSHLNKQLLLITAWGHSDIPYKREELWIERKEQIEQFAHMLGSRNSYLKSNYRKFHKRKVLDALSPEITSWRIFAVEGIGWIGMVAPIMFCTGYRLLYLPSTISREFRYPAAANPYVDNNLSVAGISVFHDQFELNRIDKNELIDRICTEKRLQKPYLKVCEKPLAYNCNRCQKCLRTALAFMVLGIDPAPYGFSLSRPEIIELTKELLTSPECFSTTVWHLEHIQHKIQQKRQAGQAVDADLEWLVEIDLASKVTNDIAHNRQIDWKELDYLLPPQGDV